MVCGVLWSSPFSRRARCPRGEQLADRLGRLDRLGKPGGNGGEVDDLLRMLRPHPSVERIPGVEPTTVALGPLRTVHDRMPLLLTPDALADWLDPDTDPTATLSAPDLDGLVAGLELRPVSRAVGNHRNEGPHLTNRPRPAQDTTAGSHPASHADPVPSPCEDGVPHPGLPKRHPHSVPDQPVKTRRPRFPLRCGDLGCHRPPKRRAVEARC